MTLLSTLLTALFAGLLGSVHCFGMCGGIAAAMAASGPGTDGRKAISRAIRFNTGRILGYVVLGAAAGVIAGGTGELLQIKQWAFILRLATAGLIFLLGCHYLFGWRSLDWIERGGARIWRYLSRTGSARSASGGGSALRLGVLWGWLPCGLVYTLLLTAAATGDALQGGLVMLAFGAGTLPSMTGTMLAVPLAMHLRSSLAARRIIGGAMILFAAWTAAMPLMHAAHRHAAG